MRLINRFFYRTHLLWNKLPLDIRAIINLSTFKNKLLKFLWDSVNDYNEQVLHCNTWVGSARFPCAAAVVTTLQLLAHELVTIRGRYLSRFFRQNSRNCKMVNFAVKMANFAVKIPELSGRKWQIQKTIHKSWHVS